MRGCTCWQPVPGGAKEFGFTNGQSKMLMIDLVSIARTALCMDHNLRLNVYVQIFSFGYRPCA